ncbi:MAG: hypothetical protein IKE69_08460, partial [Thermoguttaceae bacterium]|nr:hypothetical protein [Thermoguttaceae bacterium]
AGGTVTFSVQAVSGDYTAVQSKTLTVVNTPPRIELSGPIVGEANSPITWSGSFTDPGSDTWTASVLVVETGQSQNVALGSDRTFCFSQTFSEVGRYTLELSISDGSEISTVRKEILIGGYPAGGIGSDSLVAVQEGTYSVLLSGSTITLPPAEPGTLTAQAFWLVNRGNESITLEWSDLSLPEGLFLLTGDAFVPGEDIVLGAGERFYAELGWNAAAPLSGTVTIPTDETDFLLHFTGTPLSITDSPALSSFGLLCDSGDSSSDRITCNPIIAGTIAGNFAGGTVRVEFDHDGDGVAEGSKVLYFDGMSFRYDPRQSDADWPEVLSGTESVELSYRLIHLKKDGTPYSTGNWTSFEYTLVPIPAGAATVGNLCVGAGSPGAWTLAGSAVLTGTVTGTAEQVEVRVGGQTFFVEVKSQQFSLALPALAFGETVTIRARALSDNTALHMAVPGSWTTTTITPALPAVTSLALVTDDGDSSSDGISSVLTLTGTLAAGVGRAFTEVEFSCGNTILGSSWTDENGCFVWTPTGLPITGGIATGTITAKAVWRPEEGLPVYGTSASLAVTYAPAESSEPLTLSLADATNTAGTQTGTPLITVLGTFHSEAIVRYEYQWKTSEGQWSTAEQSYAAAADEVNEDNEADFEASLRLSGFGALTGTSS